MKECPSCHARYDDLQNFCVVDGTPLRSVADDSKKYADDEVTLQDVPPVPLPLRSGTPRPVSPVPPVYTSGGADSDASSSSASGISSATTTGSPIVKPRTRGGCLRKVIIAVVVICVGLFCLYNHIMNAATYLRMEPSRITASKGGGECKIDIDYDGYVWQINHKPDWVTVSESDDYFDITVRPNTSGDVREGSVTVQSGKQLAQVIIRQLGYATHLRLSVSNIRFSKCGESKGVTIDTDGCAWTVEYPDWVSIKENGDDGVGVQCVSNDGEYRSGVITFKEDNVSASIYVSQAGKCNTCHGEGSSTCNYCSGTGSLGFGMFYSSCMWCGGNGSIKCGTCGGTGQRE